MQTTIQCKTILLAVSVLATLTFGCAPPFERIAGYCLYVHNSPRVDWHEASSLCRDIRGRLLACYAIFSELVRNYSSAEAFAATKLAGDKVAWVGVTDQGDERGSQRSGWRLTAALSQDPEQLLPLDDALWVSGQPDNYGGNQNCVAMQRDEPLLNDHSCGAQFRFICEQPSRTQWRPILSTPPDAAIVSWNATVLLSDAGEGPADCAYRAGAIYNCARFAYRKLAAATASACLLDSCYGLASVARQLLVGGSSVNGWSAYEIQA